ncbi:MAG: bifunctional folylpolyglutamate synthase/dihydrofolate synthase [Phycisphaeraceae bacterium]|nr:bifunctional folylpolyglutamate synthase/dihydrofolate synthase [Phycisphaeraceae bacterium]MCW5755127.1 bifunctional folylpolyglutamate synthase/dihydrofolate synthase [Phycisphaeraceae bacterium]
MPKTSSAAGRTGRAREAVTTALVAPRRLSDLTSALEYLSSRTNFERANPAHLGADAFRLERMHGLLERLGQPHRDSRFVHVAGSKGKGSTVEMVASCLSACGYTVGVYTSPHLIDVRERIRLGSSWIAEADFVRLMRDVAEAAADVVKRLGEATYFEVLTALALKYFAEQAVDVAVIEVGLGGRLDSTNVITPEVCAITAIQLEHTQILGETLDLIAREKAGIMKPGVPCVTIEQPPEVLGVFRERAAELNTPLLVLGQDIDFSYRFEASPELGPHVRVCVQTSRSNFEHLPVPLRGHHQAANCGIALGVLDRLRERGFDTPERDVAAGLARTPSEGRMELVWERPRILIDGAHTAESIEAFMKAVGAHMRYDSMVAIFGCAADKSVDGLLQKLALGADKVIFTQAAGNPRAAKPADLARRFSELCGKMSQVEPSVKDAINTAYRSVGHEDLICVTGSFYVAGEAKQLLTEAKSKRSA